ncbi:hypothetical protein PAL_GLEAN10003370 [Pteropus alecto]|uniref:Uncharacterized protein n=1 Tax=Pteropus alecto TaxID=9402 RepID=L5K2I6_PTEAL|nr:hypothetical protein PAL_GLEAN10003370 [Pteropus alecto]
MATNKKRHNPGFPGIRIPSSRKIWEIHAKPNKKEKRSSRRQHPRHRPRWASLPSSLWGRHSEEPDPPYGAVNKYASEPKGRGVIAATSGPTDSALFSQDCAQHFLLLTPGHANTYPRGYVPTRKRAHVDTYPRGYVPTRKRAHADTSPHGNVPTWIRAHADTWPRNGNVPTWIRAHADTCPHGNVPTWIRAHADTWPRNQNRDPATAAGSRDLGLLHCSEPLAKHAPRRASPKT